MRISCLPWFGLDAKHCTSSFGNVRVLDRGFCLCVLWTDVCVCVFFLDRGGLTNSCMLAELWVRSRKPQESYWHAPTTIITHITDNHEANNNEV